MLAHAALAVGAALPVAHVDLVATDVNIVIREEVEHLTINILAELQHSVLARTKWRGEELSPARTLSAGESVVIVDGTKAMAGDVDFRHDIDSTLAGEGHNLTDVVLRVETTILSSVVELIARQLQVRIVLALSIAHADGVLVVGYAPRTTLGEQGIFLDFYAPALVVGEMPVELVNLVKRQHIEQLHHFLFRKEVA